MKKEQAPQRFEEKLTLLEQMTAKMEEGDLALEDLLTLYEQGVQLANSLKKDLDAAQAALMEVKDGQIKPLKES